MHITDISPRDVQETDTEYDKLAFDYYWKYYDLHKPAFMQPTNIKVDVDLFNEEIKSWHHLFRQWGNNRPNNPRYGISLVNLDGEIEGEYDYGCSPMDLVPKELGVWEYDFKVRTPVYDTMESMRVFDPIVQHMIRSNILLFHKGGNFAPHIDTCPLPYKETEKDGWNLRLWGNTDPDNYMFSNLGHKNKDLEPGRLYLVDTTQWHIAESLADWNYTFFIAINSSCIDEVHKWLI